VSDDILHIVRVVWDGRSQDGERPAERVRADTGIQHNFNANRYLGWPNVPGAASLCLGNASLQIVDSDWYALVTELLMGKSLYP